MVLHTEPSSMSSWSTCDDEDAAADAAAATAADMTIDCRLLGILLLITSAESSGSLLNLPLLLFSSGPMRRTQPTFRFCRGRCLLGCCCSSSCRLAMIAGLSPPLPDRSIDC